MTVEKIDINQLKLEHSLSGQTNTLSSINGQELKVLLHAALRWLKANHQLVNSLNVFPVPDGDTGTNMLLTMQSAYNDIQGSEDTNIGKITHDFAQGALMGARGNSGVILSQIFRGLSRALDNLPEMDTRLFATAISEARNTAYKGVVRPVEGTILTVIKDVSIALENSAKRTTDLVEMLEDAVKAADESVKFTPELLPILKTAGVVDSGGKGLFFLFEGMLRSLKNLPLDEVQVVQDLSTIKFDETMESVEDGQDVEVVIDFAPADKLDLEAFYCDLEKIGTSVQVGEGDGLYRMHIHVQTEKQDEPEALVKKLGTISKVYKEDLVEQMARIKAKKEELVFHEFTAGTIAVVVVSPGIGLSRIFASQGAAAIVTGGQTMNPSIQEILKAFEDLPTDKVIILPNNKNVILAANSAKALSVKNVEVIPTRNVSQGISAILRWSPDGDFNQIVDDMNESLEEASCGEITLATRTVDLNGVNVEKGKTIGLLNGKLVVAGENVQDTCLDLFTKADMENTERITLFYGSNIEEPEVNQVAEKIQETYPNHEIEIHYGGQPHYFLIISIE
ncbi:MAG TPA: DAK2 domain-containing protein [Anaerolineaceae bacterium]|nr:DAK2 domain-containing protein [Anaerolineaceae bacterium]